MDSKITRIRFLSLLFLGLGAIIVLRLGYIQIIHGEIYKESAERQYVIPEGQIFERGKIFFTEKGGSLVSAATLKSGYFLTIAPKNIIDTEEAYKMLSSIIEIDEADFRTKVDKKEDPYEEITHRLSEEEAKNITALKIPGVTLYREKWRFYPGNTLSSQAIGFLGYKDNTLAGRYGLERQYEETLSRNSGGAYVNFFAEVFGDLKESIFAEAISREGDIVTSIDPEIQTALEKELADVEASYISTYSGGIIMDPKTGKIYAIALDPSFDLNNFKSTDPKKFSNKIVEGVYEMGSIVKPITMASALDAGAITPETTYFDEGFLTLNKWTIYNFDKKGRGRVNMQEVLNQSLNTGATFAMQSLGKDKFRDYLLAFGFGEKTGIDLPNETKGLISNLYVDRDIEFANASFGQGIALSPIAMTRALATLGNGGYLVTPHLVERIDFTGGLSETLKYPKGAQVIKPETSEQISRMLVRVYDDALLGGVMKLPRYSIAAKTGTAQLAREDGKGYYDDRFLHSFFGYFPAYDPKFIIFLFTLDPKGERYASHTLAKPFNSLARFLISYYEVPPDR